MLEINEDNGIVTSISELMQKYYEVVEDLEVSLAEIHDPREESQIILLLEECGQKLGMLSDLYSHIRRQSQCSSLYGHSSNVLCADEDNVCIQKPTQDVENTEETYADDSDNGGVYRDATAVVDGSRVATAVKLEDGSNKATLEMEWFDDGMEQVFDHADEDGIGKEATVNLLDNAEQMNQDMDSHQMSAPRTKTKTGDVTPLEIMHWIGEQYWNGEMKTFLRLVFDSGGGNLYQKHCGQSRG